MLRSIADWFLTRIGPNPSEPVRLRGRASLFVFPYFWVCAVLDFLVSLLGPWDSVALQTFLLQSALLIGLLILLKLTGRVALLIGLDLFVSLAIESSNALHSAWTFDPMMLGLVLRITVAAFFLGNRWAIVFCALNTLVALAVFQVNTAEGDSLPQGLALTLGTYRMGVHVVLAILVVAAMTRLYDDELRTQSQDLDQSRRQAFRAARYNRLGHMLGELNHHINNPLAILEASFYRVQSLRHPPAAEQELLLQPIDNSLARIRYIINELKLISRIDHREPEHPQSVRTVCRNILLMTEESCQKNSIHLQFVDRTQNTSFVCRPHQLVRILSAIVINACEAGARIRGFRIEIIIGLNDSHIEFQVEDSGPGVPKELEPKLFEPFFTTKPTHSHAGLSLATSRSIVEEMGGSLTYQAQSPGASFRLALPLKKSEVA